MNYSSYLTTIENASQKKPSGWEPCIICLKKKLKQQIKILEIGVEQLIVFYFTVNEEIVDNRELNEQWNGKKKTKWEVS